MFSRGKLQQSIFIDLENTVFEDIQGVFFSQFRKLELV